MDAGAIGELLGYGMDAGEHLMTGGVHERLTSYRPVAPATRPTVIVQSAAIRVPGIHATLTCRLASGLITDDNTLRKLLAF